MWNEWIQQFYCRMSKQTTRSTKKSLGLVSDRQIQLWNSEERHRSKEHPPNNRRGVLGRKGSDINNEQEMSMVFDTSLNQLREKTRTERSTSSTLSNRIKYLEGGLKRKRQMVELAKSKYQRMMEARHQSFLQKKELSKQRHMQNKRHLMSVTLQATRIKVQRKNSTITSQIWKGQNQQAANSIKDRRQQNERMIAQRAKMEVQKKKQMVEKQHRQSDLSREKLRKLSNERVLQGKQQHNKKMLQQYAKSEIQRRKNASLMNMFTERVKKIGQSASKYQLQLRQYEKMLGMRLGTNKSSSKGSFYVTS